MIRVEKRPAPTLNSVVKSDGPVVMTGYYAENGQMGYAAFKVSPGNGRLTIENDIDGVIDPAEVPYSELGAAVYAAYQGTLLAISTGTGTICTASDLVINALHSASKGLMHPITDLPEWPTEVFNSLLQILNGASVQYCLVTRYGKADKMAETSVAALRPPMSPYGEVKETPLRSGGSRVSILGQIDVDAAIRVGCGHTGNGVIFSVRIIDGLGLNLDDGPPEKIIKALKTKAQEIKSRREKN